MILKKGYRVVLIATLALGASFASHAASIIETTSLWDGNDYFFGRFGRGATETMGQTFWVTGPETEMNSFTFYIRDLSAIVEFETYVYAWDSDDSHVTGDALFSSGPLFTTDNYGQQGFEAVTVDTGSLSLNENSRYIAFLSVSNISSGSFDQADVASVSSSSSLPNPYSSGRFFFKNNGTNFDGIYNQWNHQGPNDAAFEMTFSAPSSPVPEPATITLLGLGIAGLIARGRRSAA